MIDRMRLFLFVVGAYLILLCADLFEAIRDGAVWAVEEGEE